MRNPISSETTSVLFEYLRYNLAAQSVNRSKTQKGISMNDRLYALCQQHYLITRTVTIFVIIAVWWFVYRLYKLVGRRCRNCGSIFGNKRKSKIRLAPDESISIFSTNKRLRWWIRRVDTETYSVCDCGWKESVKISKGPISVWHAWWTRLIDRQQYVDDSELLSISDQATRDRRSLKHLGNHAHLDTPPVVVNPWRKPKKW